jgi:hypothetical protein
MLRGERVMFDFHLSMLYNVETRSLKQAVRRNEDRFPEDFMFELTDKEVDFLRSQNVISNKGRGGLRYAPMAFTEQGVAMLASVLKSSKAVQVNIAIMRSFVLMRRMMEDNKELKKKIEQLESKYDKEFAVVFEAIKQLIHQESKPRNQIGFKTKNV